MPAKNALPLIDARTTAKDLALHLPGRWHMTMTTVEGSGTANDYPDTNIRYDRRTNGFEIRGKGANGKGFSTFWRLEPKAGGFAVINVQDGVTPTFFRPVATRNEGAARTAEYVGKVQGVKFRLAVTSNPRGYLFALTGTKPDAVPTALTFRLERP